jgi:hypothetical protein
LVTDGFSEGEEESGEIVERKVALKRKAEIRDK